jgi:hypothetical protein
LEFLRSINLFSDQEIKEINLYRQIRNQVPYGNEDHRDLVTSEVVQRLKEFVRRLPRPRMTLAGPMKEKWYRSGHEPEVSQHFDKRSYQWFASFGSSVRLSAIEPPTSSGGLSEPSIPSDDGAIFAFVSAPQSPLVAVARANSEEATSGAVSLTITSIDLGSGSGIAAGELGDATSALGVPICIGWDSGCGIKPAGAGELTDTSGVLPD